MNELDKVEMALTQVKNRINTELAIMHATSTNEYGDGTVNGLLVAIAMIDREIQIVRDVRLLGSM